MITFFTGKPRSGKSYRAVWYIQKNFIDPKSSTYSKHHYLYTNIGGFKHDFVNETLSKNPLDLDDGEFVKQSFPIDWKVLYSHFKKMYEMFQAEKSDDEILRYARYHKLTPALYVYDEAYKYYTKKSDPVLVFINAYHGHLGMDIIFIIHSFRLMHLDYKAHTEEFIDAQPKSKNLSDKSFRYKFYASEYYSKDPSYHSDSIRADNAIFSLYKSGDLHSPKKILHKFFGIIIGGVLFVAFIIYQLFNSFSEDITPPPSSDSNITTSSVVNSSPSSKYVLLRVRCDDLSCCRVDPAFVVSYVPKLFFNELLNSVDNVPVASSTTRVFDVNITDSIYKISADSMALFSFWNIPLNPKTKGREKSFNGAGDII
jgi:hypothetical protein